MSGLTLVNPYVLQAGTTGFALNQPAGLAEGDIDVVWVASKLSSVVPTITGPYQLIDSQVVGTGADGVDTGPVRLTFWWRELQTGFTSETVTVSGGSVCMGGGIVWRPDPDSKGLIVPTVLFGTDATSDTTLQAVMSAIAPAGGRDVLYAVGVNTRNEASSGGRGTTTTGLTATNTGIDSGGSNNGNHLFVWSDRVAVGGGSLSAAASVNSNFTTATTGGGAMVLLNGSDGVGEQPPPDRYTPYGQRVDNIPTEPAPQELAYTGKRIAFVRSFTVASTSDPVLIDILEQMGHTVYQVADTDAIRTDVDLHVISESGAPANLGTKYQNLAVPVVSLEVGGWDDQLWASGNGTNPGSTSTFLTTAGTNPITTEFGTSTTVTDKTSSGGTYGIDSTTLTTGAGIDVWATHPTTTTSWHIFAYDTGALLIGGTPAAARQAGWGLVDSQGTALNDAGKQTFRDIIVWALTPSAASPDVNVADTPTGIRLGGITETLAVDQLVADTPTGLRVYTGVSESVDVTVLDAPTGLRVFSGSAETPLSDTVLADTPTGARIFSGVVETVAADVLVSDTPTGLRLGGVRAPEFAGAQTIVNDTPTGVRAFSGAAETVVFDVALADHPTGVRTFSGVAETTVIAVNVADTPTGLRVGAGVPETAAVGVTLLDLPTGLRLAAGPQETTLTDVVLLDRPTAAQLRAGVTESVMVETVTFDPSNGAIRLHSGVGETLTGAHEVQRVDITVSIGPPRIGSVDIAPARSGSVDIAPARSGSVTIDSPRTGSVEIDEARIERGP